MNNRLDTEGRLGSGQDWQTQRQRTHSHVVSTIHIPGRYEVATDLVCDFNFKHSELQASGEYAGFSSAWRYRVRSGRGPISSTSPLSNMAMTSGWYLPSKIRTR
jgi:hypothetical protein